jgi:hypothetical protein
MLMMINLLILLTQKANCMITQTVNNSRKSQLRKPCCSIRCTDSRQLNSSIQVFYCTNVFGSAITMYEFAYRLLVDSGYVLPCSMLLSLLLYYAVTALCAAL